MTSKVRPLGDAIATHVRDGACVALEGFTHLIPFAAGHEIIRQGRRNLHLVRMTPDLIYDQMIGMGCASKLTFSWGGNPGVGSQVLYSGKAYASVTAVLTNTNRQPDISPLYWTPIEFHCPIGPSYSIGDVVVWGIGVYTSLTNSNQGNVPHDNPSDWSVKVPVTVGIQ